MNSVFVLLLAAISETPQEAPAIPGWFWVLVILILVVLPLLVLAFGPGFARKESEAIEAAEAAKEEAKPEAAAKAESAAVEPDDLKKIEGIGPKIESVLQAAGIETFAQLAAAEATTLQKILDSDSRLRLADPTSWPEQGRLAAAGEWEALTKLQDELKGGRQV